VEWRSGSGLGVVREEILKTGLHDVVMGDSVVTMVVMRSFAEAGLV
jgi:abhydrolase domain-containing protein 12